MEWLHLLMSHFLNMFFIWKDHHCCYHAMPLSFSLYLCLPCTLTLCGNIHTSHIANVRMLSISLSVLLSVFHDLFTHFSPLRTSIFNRDGSMFSHGLIKDMVCMHNTHTHSMWMHMWVCCLQQYNSLYSLSSLSVVKKKRCQWSLQSRTCSQQTGQHRRRLQ